MIVDEPTTALDAITQAELPGLFRELNRDCNGAMRYVSHDLSTVASLCFRACILDAGEGIESGTPEENFTMPSQAFNRRLVGSLRESPMSISSSKHLRPSMPFYSAYRPA